MPLPEDQIFKRRIERKGGSQFRALILFSQLLSPASVKRKRADVLRSKLFANRLGLKLD